MAVIFDRWRTAQKYIRITHNKAVKNYFKEAISKGQINLRNSVLIYKQDTATQCQVKMQFFEQYIRVYEVISPVIPEWWQIRKEAHRPQLIVVFKRKKDLKDKSKLYSRWSLSLPHFVDNPDKVKHLTGYKKGNTQGILTFKDNSKLIIYGRNQAEVERTIKNWVSLNIFDEKYLDKKDAKPKLGKINKELEKTEVIPILAKYYPDGNQKKTPKWIAYI